MLTPHCGHVIIPDPRCTLPSWLTHTEQNECPHPNSNGIRSTCWRPSPEPNCFKHVTQFLQTITHQWRCMDASNCYTVVTWLASSPRSASKRDQTICQQLPLYFLNREQCNYNLILNTNNSLNTSNYIIIKIYCKIMRINNILFSQSCCSWVSRSLKWPLYSQPSPSGANNCVYINHY